MINHLIKKIVLCIVISLLGFCSLVFAEEQDSTIFVQIDSSKISLQNIYQESLDEPLSKTHYATVDSKLETALRVRVLLEGERPVSDFPVIYKVISTPEKSKNTRFVTDTVFTDINGYAENYVILGSKEGEYEFSARIDIETEKTDIVYFKAHARNSDWVFFLITGLLGGLALFLFGMEMMSEGMKKTAGKKLRVILETLTHNRFIAVAVGIFVTMVIQSSSATTVMLVSFVQAQLMTFVQTLGIILGSGIGTTITAQMIAFKLTDYALLIIGIGFIVVFISKSKKIKSIGEVLLGFGILFFGMHIMSTSMYPLRTFQPFIDLLLELENPIIGIIVGTIFTALIQSSSAFTGILIILGTQGLITLEAAIPLILGSNIGTSITAILASLNTSRESKRVAIAHTVFKVIGVLIFVWWIPDFAELVRIISPEASSSLKGLAYSAEVVPRQIANAHTVFNLVLTLTLLPFINLIAVGIVKVFPDIHEEEESLYETKFLEKSLISTPALALNLAKAEIIRMAYKAQSMVEKIIIPFLQNDSSVLEEIQNTEAEIDYLNVRISKYLMKISQRDMQDERTDEVFQMMHSVTEIEQIGDVITKRLVPLAEKMLELNKSFSEDGKTEIKDYHLRTMKQLSRAIEVLKDVNLQYAKRMEKKYKKYRLMELDLRRTHFDRLRDKVPEAIETNGIHLELIDLLKRISSNATNIARIFLETNKKNESHLRKKNSIKKGEKKA